jgi:hypothetical protein
MTSTTRYLLVALLIMALASNLWWIRTSRSASAMSRAERSLRQHREQQLGAALSEISRVLARWPDSIPSRVSRELPRDSVVGRLRELLAGYWMPGRSVAPPDTGSIRIDGDYRVLVMDGIRLGFNPLGHVTSMRFRSASMP